MRLLLGFKETPAIEGEREAQKLEEASDKWIESV
jgi:hypothetical protein